MPKWLDTAVFYEIYPQTFADTNADGIVNTQDAAAVVDAIV